MRQNNDDPVLRVCLQPMTVLARVLDLVRAGFGHVDHLALDFEMVRNVTIDLILAHS